MKPWQAKDREPAERLGLGEFVRRVSERAGFGPSMMHGLSGSAHAPGGD